MNTETLRILIAKGLTAQDILEVSEAMDAGTQRNSNAERQARFRARRKAAKDNVTNNVTRNGVTPPNDIYSNPPVSSDEETRPARKTKIPRPDGVSEQVWTDFLDHRKAKRAPVSETVIAGIRREAAKAGWTLEAALSETVTRGWQAFKAEWVAEKSTGPPGTNDTLVDRILARQPSEVLHQ